MQLKEITKPVATCKVKLTTAISANLANATISYRYVHSSGKKSPVYKVKTAANKVAVVSKEWDVPNGVGTESGWFEIQGVGAAFTSNKATYSMN